MAEPTPEPELPPEPPRPGPLGALALRAREVRDARGLLFEFVLRDLRVRYRQAALGVLWALFVPGLTVLAGALVRLLVGNAGLAGAENTTNAMAGVAVKAVGWSFFSMSLGMATPSLASNASLLSRVYFPREILPLSVVVAQCVDLLAGAATVLVLLAVLGVGVGAAALWAPLLLLLLVALAAGVGALLACGNLFFRDVRYIVQVLLTFGVFFTPVFFDAAHLGPRLAPLAMLNPVAPLLEGLRLATVGRHNLLHPLVLADGVVAWQPWHLAYSAAWAAAALAGGALLYARLELAFAEYA